jgi:predicted nucleotidyltransferase
MNDHYINQIIDKLKDLDPERVILFGSAAYGDVSEESDIDLIVVTNDEFYPKSYRERMDIYLKVSKALTEIIKEVSIDLIVYTKPMYSKFIELGSLFSKEVIKKGKVLYETHH